MVCTLCCSIFKSLIPFMQMVCIIVGSQTKRLRIIHIKQVDIYPIIL